MASIEERNGSYKIVVSCGRDIYGKKIRETTTFTPDPSLTPKKRQKAVEEFARKFEEQVAGGRLMDGRKITLNSKSYSIWQYTPALEKENFLRWSGTILILKIILCQSQRRQVSLTASR